MSRRSFIGMGLVVLAMSMFPVSFTLLIMHYVSGLSYLAILEMQFVPVGNVMDSIARQVGINIPFDPKILNSLMSVGSFTFIYVASATWAVVKAVRRPEVWSA